MARAMDAANAIFRAACAAVSPHRLVRSAISIDNDHILRLESTGSRYRLKRNVYVAAFGKAACGMSRAVDDLLHEHIVDGVVSMPKGSLDVFKMHSLNDQLPRTDTVIRYYEGAMHNLPDEHALRAAIEIREMIKRLSKDDLLLVLISGGGSALLPLPIPGISLEEKTSVIKYLSKSGATINELNTVRQHLSQLKGGRLAQLAAGRVQRIVSLIVSDIIDDPLEFIASGPTCARTTKLDDAVNVLKKYQKLGQEDVCVRKAIDLLANSNHVSDDPIQLENVDNIIIGSNRTALEAGSSEAQKLTFQSEIVSASINGEASEVGRGYAHRLDQFLSKSNGKRCWLWGGETTVQVKGSGKGGRNQEMVLAFAMEAIKLNLTERYEQTKFTFLSAGTDGQDGPTDAAGAMISSEQLKALTRENLQLMEECLERNDSYTFFSDFLNGECHIKCGLTGTNVMDVQVITVE